MRPLADSLDLFTRDCRRRSEARLVKFAHGRLVGGHGAMQPRAALWIASKAALLSLTLLFIA
jgi:hypothetical protein